MGRRTRNLSHAFAIAAALMALALLSGESSAEDLTSASYRLRGGTLSGGGEVALQSTAPIPAIGSAGVTIGQSGPPGVSTGPTSGVTLHAGFWPIMASRAGPIVLVACEDGLDNDSDGFTDYPDDPGCLNSNDPSEKDDTGWYPCDDGADNDGDGEVDFPNDAGCYNPFWFLENPACQNGNDDDGDGLVDLADPGCITAFWMVENPLCQNGSDDDGDGLIDFDGGASAGLPPEQQTDPDPECHSPGTLNERKCGVGAELVLLLLPLTWLSRRRSRWI